MVSDMTGQKGRDHPPLRSMLKKEHAHMQVIISERSSASIDIRLSQRFGHEGPKLL
jgi:hypothetical protein